MSSSDDATESLSTATVTPHLEPDMEAYALGYTTVSDEVSYRLVGASRAGSIPPDLIGTSYFRCGPAMFSAGSIVPPRTSIVQPKQAPVEDGVDPARMVRHWFEGDGAVLGVTFVSPVASEEETEATDDGVIEAAVRFRLVRTAGFTKERKKGERIYTALDSTRAMGPACAAGLGNDVPLPLFRHYMQGGLNKYRKNTSNTRVVYWGSRLLSLAEGSAPYKLDARAVSTEGRSRLGGAIKSDADAFGSKLSYDAQRQHAVFYGVDVNEETLVGRPSSRLKVYEFDSNFTLVDRTIVDLPGIAVLNDFCTTPQYAVFIQPAVVPKNAFAFLLNKEPGPTLQLDTTKSSTLHLIPRAGANGSVQKSISIPIPTGGQGMDANVQFCNAYETDNGRTIIVDAILSDGSSNKPSSKALAWPWGTSLTDYQSVASKKSLWRYTIDTSRDLVSKQLLWDHHCSFATINPRVSSQAHAYIYVNVGALGSVVAPPQGIAKYDCQTGSVTQWFPEAFEFCGEPIFTPKQTDKVDEDDGYILSVLFNGKKKESELIVLDAKDIRAGPVCRIPFGFMVPHGLHGCVVTNDGGVIGTADEIERRAKLADKIESRGNRWNEVKSDFSGLGLRLDDMEEYFGDWNPFA